MSKKRMDLNNRESQDSRFSKYASRGAYHWRMIARNIRTHHCFTVARYEIALELAGDISGKRVLDFGCGDGAFLYLLSSQGEQITGFDPNLTGLHLAEKELSKRHIQLTLTSNYEELEVGSFDIIFLLEVIEHVDDSDVLLRQVDKLLAPEGILIITTPMRLTETPIDSEHAREFFPNELRSELSAFFIVENIIEAIPLVGAEIYYWRPKFLLGRPVAKWVMNFMSIVFAKNPIYGIGAIDRYHSQLAAKCRKQITTF